MLRYQSFCEPFKLYPIWIRSLPQSIVSFRTSAPSSSSSQKNSHDGHWLDRFEGIRDWLDAANRRFWLNGVIKGRTAVTPQLQGRETLLREVLEREYAKLWKKYSPKEVVDSRSRIHCANACLAVATHRALLPFLRDERQVLEAIEEHMGAQIAPALQFLMKITSILQRDRYSALVRRLKALHLDYGKSFNTTLAIHEDSSELIVRSCPYHRIFSAEEVPQLTSCCCCTQDSMWFKDHSHPLDHRLHDSASFISFHPLSNLKKCTGGLVSSMADGHSKQCRFVVNKV